MSRIPHGHSPVELRKFAQRTSAKVTGGSDPGHAHSIYLLADGTRELTGSLIVSALVEIDGRDLSVDGTKLDGIELLADVTDATNVAAAGAAMAGGAFHDGFSDFVGTEHVALPATIASVLTDHNLAAHPEYSLIDGTRAFTGTVSGIDPTVSSHLATKEYVDQNVHFIVEYFLTDTGSDIGGIYYDAVDQNTGEPESYATSAALSDDINQPVVNYATVAGVPGVIDMEHGIYTMHFHAATISGNKPVKLHFEVHRYEEDDNETLIATSEETDYITDSKESYEIHAALSEDVDILVADRIVFKILANVEATGSNVTVRIYQEGVNSSHFAIPTSSEILSSIFLRQDGTKDLTGDLAVDPGITIDGRDIRLDGMDLDTLVTLIGKMKVDTSATADYLGAAFNDGVLRTSTGISYADGGNFVTLTTNDGEIVHDNLSGYDANKHIDHTGVSIATAATSGISGGGTIAATRNLSLNINGLTGESAIVAADTLAFYDDTAGANRKITLTQLSTALGAADEKVKIDAAATAGYLGAAAGDGVLRVNGALSYVDGGDFVTLGGSESKCKAYATSNQDIVTGTPTKVLLDTVDFDPESNFAGNTYTAPATGYYFVNGKLRTNEILADTKILSVFVYVNGAQQTAHRVPSDGVGTTIAVISDVVYVESGQSIELWCFHNHGSNRELYGVSKRTALTIHRLS